MLKKEHHLHKIIPLAEQLSKSSHFNFEECKTILMFHKLLESNGPLNRKRMKEILHVMFEITDTVMLDLTFHAFDRDRDNHVDDVEFVNGLSVLLRGTQDELIEWCYFVYDINSDGGVAREELSYCLKGCIIPGYGLDHEEEEEAERDIIETAMNLLDVDKNGRITKDDFIKAVKRDPLLIDAIGPCLPKIKPIAALLALFTENFRSYTLPFGKAEKGQEIRF